MDKEEITGQRNGIIHQIYTNGEEKNSQNISCNISCLLNEATTSEHTLDEYYVVYNY